MASPDSAVLVDNLKRTRESREELLARLLQIAERREWTVTEIAFWLNGLWASLPLDE